jgi:hypothetical protein
MVFRGRRVGMHRGAEKAAQHHGGERFCSSDMTSRLQACGTDTFSVMVEMADRPMSSVYRRLHLWPSAADLHSAVGAHLFDVGLGLSPTPVGIQTSCPRNTTCRAD